MNIVFQVHEQVEVAATSDMFIITAGQRGLNIVQVFTQQSLQLQSWKMTLEESIREFYGNGQNQVTVM